jgi:hypothetical protein
VFMASSPLPRVCCCLVELSVAGAPAQSQPLIADKRYYGEVTAKLRRGDGQAMDLWAGLGRHQAALGRGPDEFQLLVQPLGRDRHGGANLLGEQGDLELLYHPPKRFDLALRLA